MGGRGTYASGRNVPQTFKTIGEIGGIKVLEGIGKEHGFPYESKTSDAYIKLHPDGRLKQLIVFDKEHKAVLEIGYHRERSYAEKMGADVAKPILHAHRIDLDAGNLHGAPMEVPQKYLNLFADLLRGL